MQGGRSVLEAWSGALGVGHGSPEFVRGHIRATDLFSEMLAELDTLDEPAKRRYESRLSIWWDALVEPAGWSEPVPNRDDPLDHLDSMADIVEAQSVELRTAAQKLRDALTTARRIVVQAVNDGEVEESAGSRLIDLIDRLLHEIDDPQKSVFRLKDVAATFLGDLQIFLIRYPQAVGVLSRVVGTVIVGITVLIDPVAAAGLASAVAAGSWTADRILASAEPVMPKALESGATRELESGSGDSEETDS